MVRLVFIGAALAVALAGCTTSGGGGNFGGGSGQPPLVERNQR